jgi:hypothetical protein
MRARSGARPPAEVASDEKSATIGAAALLNMTVPRFGGLGGTAAMCVSAKRRSRGVRIDNGSFTNVSDLALNLLTRQVPQGVGPRKPEGERNSGCRKEYLNTPEDLILDIRAVKIETHGRHFCISYTDKIPTAHLFSPISLNPDKRFSQMALIELITININTGLASMRLA